VGQVPLHGFADAAGKGFGGLPAEFAFEFARVYGVAAIVAGAVLHEGDLLRVRLAVGARRKLVEDGAQGLHDFEVGFFVPAADVVGLAHAACGEHAADGAAVVLHVEPIADLPAVAVDRQGLARERMVDAQGDEFFGEVVGPVVVAAVGGEHGQTVGVVPGAHEVVAGGLARAVGAVGLVAVLLGERGRVCGERAIDFVGAHVQEAECFFFRSC